MKEKTGDQGGRLAGKSVLVTGGASGIGEAVVRLFVAESARVAILDRDVDRAEAIARDCDAGAVTIPMDVTDPDDWSRAVHEATACFGEVDVLVNNAGGGRGGGRLEDEDPSVHRRILDLNVGSVWAGTRAVLPSMRAAGGGSIVNISSIDGLVGARGAASYVASKFAVTGLTKAAALELGADGIRVNAVHPGFVATPLLSGRDPELIDQLRDAAGSQPIPRFGLPEEIASAVLFFASDESSFCTGSSLVVDGGRTAGSR
ncbi:SDR family NAD(P)-dependent oxidoreductase [Microbacterium sp. A196]|uniref:SDR family NAD(P)-dependent oxidoreductase n=1 Tax=Microbacterium sp. A196 TaxID=3457320 RepID=UPI003FD437EF